MPDDGFFSASVARSYRPKPLAIARCDECGLYRAGCGSPKMPRDGRGRKRILVVTETPGRDDDANGTQLVGRAGQFLDRRLAAVGIDLRQDCHLTTAARCRPPRGDLGAHPKAVDACRPFVLKDVAETAPTLVLLFGQRACRSVLGHLWGKDDVGAIGRWAGQRVPAHAPNAWVCPLDDPDDVLAAGRAGDTFMADEFDRHLAAAAKLVGTVPWPDGPPDYPALVEVVADPGEAARRLGRYTGGNVAFDYETTCLKPDGDGRIVCASVCWEGVETIAFPWHGAVIPAMKRLLADPAVGKIMQNATMEIRWTRRVLGVAPANVVFDTMLAAHAISPRERQKERGGGVTGLKFLAFARLGVPDYSQHLNAMLDGGHGGYAKNKVDEIDKYQLMKYCGQDSLLEFDLATILAAELGVPL